MWSSRPTSSSPRTACEKGHATRISGTQRGKRSPSGSARWRSFRKHRLSLRPGDKVIDVGAADGYLLSLFKDRGASTLGFEAAENLCQLAQDNGISVVNALFTMESLSLIPDDFRRAQVLVLLHTLE